MTPSPSTLATILPLILPSLSLLYAVSIQGFNASWHEITWTYMITPISIRVAILAACLGILLPTIEQEDTNTIILTSAITGVVFGLLSMVMIYRIRKIYISGPKPKCLMTLVVENEGKKGTKKNEKVIMITGANAGIGREATRQLVSIGSTVIMACRSESRANEAIEDIVQSLLQQQQQQQRGETTKLLKDTEKDIRSRLIFLQMDVSDPSSVHKGVKTFLDKNMPLDVLITNAGIMMGHRRTTKVMVPDQRTATKKEKESEKGEGEEQEWEMNMAANHLGHFLLMNLLLPTLQKQDGARIVVTTSSTFKLANKGMDLQDLHCEQKKYGMFSQYAQSKLANILTAVEMGRRESKRVITNDNSSSKKNHKVRVCCLHPGLVRTDVVKNMQWYMRFLNELFGFIIRLLQKTPEEGAYTTVFCAMDESLNIDNDNDDEDVCRVEYFVNSKAEPTNDFARDMETAEALWEISCDLVKIDYEQCQVEDEGVVLAEKLQHLYRTKKKVIYKKEVPPIQAPRAR